MKNGKLDITREQFVKLMLKIRRKCDMLDDLNLLFAKYDMDIVIFAGEDLDVAVEALHMAFGEADKDDWISYYCWELDFGREWEPGMITAKNGDDIKLETPDDLYDLLMENLNR